MFKAVDGMTDRLDILVNNAGISGLEGDNSARTRIAEMVEKMQAGETPEGAPRRALHGSHG